MKRTYVLLSFMTACLFFGCQKKISYNPIVTPAVATYYPINVTASSAMLEGFVGTGGGNVSEQGFYWIIETSDLDKDSGDVYKMDSLLINKGHLVKASLNKNQNINVTIDGLIKDTAYYVIAFAMNNKGITYGDPLMFRSSKLVPPSVNIEQDYASIGDSAVFVTGEVLAVGGDMATERGFIWGTNSNPDSDMNKIVLGSGQGNFTDTISSLKKFVKYYIFTYALNSIGITYSNPVIVLFVPPTYTDPRDGQIYTVQVYGGTIWMTQNFRYLPAVGNAAGIWVQGYNGTNVDDAKATDNYKTYGCLYNLQQAIDLAPQGWHLATDEDWNKLEIISSNGALDSASADVYGWIESVNSSRLKDWSGSSNDMDFNLLPGGQQWCGGAFQDFGVWAHYWAAKEGFPYTSAYRRMLAGWDNGIYREDTKVDGTPTCVGMSVRYVKDQ